MCHMYVFVPFWTWLTVLICYLHLPSYAVHIIHEIYFLYTTTMVSQWIIMQYCRNYFCILKATENLCKDKNGVTACDKKNLPWFVVWYDFYPTWCLFSITLPRLGDRRHQTSWIKTHIQPQTMEDILNLLICYFIDLLSNWFVILLICYFRCATVQ